MTRPGCLRLQQEFRGFAFTLSKVGIPNCESNRRAALGRPPFLIFGLVIRNNENRLIKEQISGINSLYLHNSKYARVRDPRTKADSWTGKADAGRFSVDTKVGGEWKNLL